MFQILATRGTDWIHSAARQSMDRGTVPTTCQSGWTVGKGRYFRRGIQFGPNERVRTELRVHLKESLSEILPLG